jgi:aspartate 1-decarboxylase
MFFFHPLRRSDEMFRQFLLGKIHQCTVTRSDPDYVGSISIDGDLLEAAGMLPYEKVLIVNLTHPARFESYAIQADRGSRVIGMNGGCAHLAQPGDICLIMAFAYVKDGEVARPRTVIIGPGNEIEAIIEDEIPVPVTSIETIGLN